MVQPHALNTGRLCCCGANQDGGPAASASSRPGGHAPLCLHLSRSRTSSAARSGGGISRSCSHGCQAVLCVLRGGTMSMRGSATAVAAPGGGPRPAPGGVRGTQRCRRARRRRAPGRGLQGGPATGAARTRGAVRPGRRIAWTAAAPPRAQPVYLHPPLQRERPSAPHATLTGAGAQLRNSTHRSAVTVACVHGRCAVCGRVLRVC